MNRKLLGAALVAIISACAPLSSVQNEWIAEPNSDPFASQPVCRVTIAHVRTGSSLSPFAYQLGNRIYPVVFKRGSDIYVGAISVPVQLGGRVFHQPVGDVQMKVDQQSAWMIAAAETPNVGPKGTSADIIAQQQRAAMASMPANPNFDPTAIASMTQTMMSGVASLGSPVTLASGDKAAMILGQMKTGSQIMYRQIAGNASGTISSFSLAGFAEAASRCGL